jgi:1,2-dihydroxy-3-keto-5-methylthiopentene dioxygenase
MSSLSIYPEGGSKTPKLTTSDPAEIAALLAERGVRFEQWDASVALKKGATQDEILAAYADDVNRIMDEGGYKVADVLALTPDHPEKAAFRNKFLNEHTHSEDEVRFFVDGAGAFYFHIGDEALQVVCTKGDLMSVPTGVKHWFDMGPNPSFTVIRIFTDPAGWVANFTGDAIATKQPAYGEPVDA